MNSTERPDRPAITSTRSDRVRRIASLSGRSARSRHGLFRVEGPQAVRSLLQQHPGSVRDLFLTERAETDHTELADLARSVGIPPVTVETDVLRAMVRDEDSSGALISPQGVVATAIPVHVPLADALGTLAEGPATVVVLHEVRDPGNAGTLLRTADAAGADLVVLTSGSVDVFAPKCVRSSVGSLFHVPVVVGADPERLYTALDGAGIVTAATSGYAEQDLFEIELPDRLAWILGNEAHGLPEQVRGTAGLTVRIPLAGRAESLNVTTAATVCLFEQLRRRRMRS